MTRPQTHRNNAKPVPANPRGTLAPASRGSAQIVTTLEQPASPVWPEFNASGLKSYGDARQPDEQVQREKAGEAPPVIGHIGRNAIRTAVNKRRLARLARTQNAAAAIGTLPAPGEQLMMILTGDFHGFDVLNAMLDLAGDVVAEEVLLCSLGFNNSQADTLAELIDAGRIRDVVFLLSNMFVEKNAREFDYLSSVLNERGGRIYASRNHCKIMALKLADGRHYVAHGSLNLRRCNSFEQLCIARDRELYQFFRDYIEDVAGSSTS